MEETLKEFREQFDYSQNEELIENQKNPLQEIWDRAQKSDCGSKGVKCDREKLYDREICKHKGK